MGVFNKLKSIFYDEVVVEDETQELDKVSKIVKKESSRDEAPKVEELTFKSIDSDSIDEEEKIKPKYNDDIKDEPLSEKDLFRSERSFNFVDWDNDEEEKLPPRKTVLDETPRVVRSTEPARDETPKVFKPTPVISPIWGVLDKDYKKDEIKEKPVSAESFTSSVTEYDNVRRKAYGTLEDELEDSLNTLNKLSSKEVNEKLSKDKKVEKKEVEVLDNRTAKIEDLIDKIDEATNELDKNMSIEEAESKVKVKDFDEEDDENVNDKTFTDSTLEHDLFNLIDSMYDKEE